MHVKYKKVLWEAYGKVHHELLMFDKSSQTQDRDRIWDYNPYVGIFKIDEARILLQELNYLRNLHRQVVNDNIGRLIRPKSFDLTIKYMKHVLDFKNEINIDIVYMYEDKDKSKIKRQLNVEAQGLEYYIEKLNENAFVDALPEEILTFSQKYDQ